MGSEGAALSSKPPSQQEPRNGVGVTALVTGIISVVSAFIPIAGEVVTGPTAVAAIVCGWVGYIRADKGLATNPRDAVIGGGLGVLSIFVVFLVFAATNGAET